ncbi:MAG TPA: NAD(+) diphosphatase [Burkholderiaceae bacterium]|nr:NAD(+) diphosphatase [Burkholderiaceae bacterium]
MLSTPHDFIALAEVRADPQRLTFIFRRDELLVRDIDLALPPQSLCNALGIAARRCYPVGLLDGRYCETTWVGPHAEPPAGYGFMTLRRMFGATDDRFLAVAGRAYQVAEWARTHQYCGACATPMAMVDGERCLKCPTCGHAAYPRISPAMMVLVRRGDEILLARHSRLPTSRFTALAGFLEAGESIEEAVHREVFEEVGLVVSDLKYFGSQSWPFPHSLMIAFTAEYAGGEIAVDRNEISEARWFGPNDEIPPFPTTLSIAGELIGAHLPRRR